ncbi:hypothetical protein [Rhizobium ruizarguesonis]|jgi:hypothetical protein|uniref:hypothetical protein n=1 Tax=Rhizobium ruizarguesonis TaxID=2081791 RepID=UPI00036A5AFD|nr:hypothetical protein [Rhizobium ruizarguesonis]TAZ86949.1 hypothetical protein ELH67_33180 [Rhizobium ruizarguesonis]TBA31937.1 hypothetical protein ELH60_25755 [Rhizobium ruizarguesonis]TBA50948.1 hypothetical protein ELH59_31885 [Rhizobium ruizarguesonis]TBA95538.1 hypothetical protein ELH55_29825 [Rhizobium ruizarguesonis]TBB36600.1 hypothetical protein ELH46_32365 [Rhizobium ruizarguesonis]
MTKSGDFEIHPLTVFYHEAGHAVMMLALGRHGVAISIVGRERGQTAQELTAEHIALHQAGDRRTLIADLLVAAAGLGAEFQFVMATGGTSDGNIVPSHTDNEKIFELLKRLDARDLVTAHLVISHVAGLILQNRWEHVESIVRYCQTNSTLSAVDMTALTGQVTLLSECEFELAAGVLLLPATWLTDFERPPSNCENTK